MFGDESLEDLLSVGHLLGLDLDIARLTADAAERLMHHDAGVRQGVTLALGSCAEKKLSHRCAETHADRADVWAHELHRVVDRHTRGD